MKRLHLGLLLVLALCFASCESFWTPMKVLLEHDNPVVQKPAAAGACLGGVVGVPVAVAAFPVMIPISAAADANMGPLAPVATMAQVGAIAVGGPFWLAAGWW